MGGEVVSCILCGHRAFTIEPGMIPERVSSDLLTAIKNRGAVLNRTLFSRKKSSAYEPESEIEDFVLNRWVIPTS